MIRCWLGFHHWIGGLSIFLYGHPVKFRQRCSRCSVIRESSRYG